MRRFLASGGRTGTRSLIFKQKREIRRAFFHPCKTLLVRGQSGPLKAVHLSRHKWTTLR